MAIQKLALVTTHAHKGKRLDQVLADWLPQALAQPVSKAKVRRLIVAGAVYLNGKRVRIASKELQANARVEAFVDKERLLSDAVKKDAPFKMDASHVLYEDEWLIAVNKPAGLPTQPTIDEARDNLFAAVKKFLAERDRVQPYVGLHHRLDRDTSGVVLFTKHTDANAGVASLFADHKAVKTYNALTVRPMQKGDAAWVIKNYLGKDRGTSGKRAKFTAVRSGGDFAHTDFRILRDGKNGLWIEAIPRTGRTHQIRVHLSESRLPILGDVHYGAPKESAPRVMLHAVSLEFPHPITEKSVRVESPLPEDFKRILAGLS